MYINTQIYINNIHLTLPLRATLARNENTRATNGDNKNV